MVSRLSVNMAKNKCNILDKSWVAKKYKKLKVVIEAFWMKDDDWTACQLLTETVHIFYNKIAYSGKGKAL